MSRKAVMSVGMFFAVSAAFAQEPSLSCDVVNDGVEKIQCTFTAPRKNEERETTFYWHSESHPQDDREHTIILPAGHGSVYDYRYLRGRAQGIWTVTVTLTHSDGSETEVSHHFTLEDTNIVDSAR
jgi:hypothetical protein